jgi:hypothetical protein
MPVAQEHDREGPQDGKPARRRGRRVALGLALAVLAGGSALWVSRERIATNLIDDYLRERGVAATYDIVSIAPDRQVIANLVIGDPARPDLTVRQVVIETGVGWAGPELSRVSLDGARVFASFRGGKFSLGALDPLVFTGGAEPPALPAINLVIRDARGLIESDYGRIGLTLEGAGRLDDGFAATLAATAPGIGVEGCRAERATLYGTLTTSDGAPVLDGPLRLAGLACAGAALARADIGARLSLAKDFAEAEGDFAITGTRAAFATLSGAGVDGTARLGWAGERLSLAHDITLSDVTAPQGRIAQARAEGAWRGPLSLVSGQWEGTLRAGGLAPAADLTASLAAAERGAEGTLLAPLIAKARGGLTRALDGADFSAEAIIRHDKASAAELVIPSASLATRSGTRVLALSRTSARIGSDGLSDLSGNILAGGEGLPNINGRMEQDASGAWALQLAMAEYSAGADRIAIPRLALRSGPGGAMAFDGVLTASGALPGGGVRDLTVPIEGRWSAGSGLALGTRCTPVRFASLALSGLALQRQAITLCPEGKVPMLAWRDSLSLAARTGPLDLEGALGESPVQLAASSVIVRYPQPFAVEGLLARIGSGESEMRLSAANLAGSLAGEIGGAFDGGSARLAAVPLNLDAIAGRWRFADGVVEVSEGAFTLTDRPAEGTAARFSPLAAKGARLTLVDNRITADARLDDPDSGRSVAAVAITHNLDSAAGAARLMVPGVVFDERLQPKDLSYLAEGVVALAEGTVKGEGRVDWTADAVTSSGTFASDRFDFAAAFGPVRGVAGKVVFTDLLGLTTAPDQRLSIAAINSGVEVLGGVVQFELKDGTLLSLEDARFPFMGGSLVMRPLVMDFSQPEERRYIFEITGLDAATFVSEMELANISATGVFDGTVPVVFDTNGNGRIDGGLLIARPGGGNVSYLGDLTYENLGAMGNYAFSALRSLDYRQMQVGLGGDLAGEIITNFEFDGVRQGEGASRNFVTRQLAKLPIRFRINVRSQSFSQLALIARGYGDPTAWGDPFAQGLIRIEDGRLVPRDPAIRTLPPAATPPKSKP